MSLIDGVRTLVSTGSDTGRRVEALDAAVTAGEGRLDGKVLTEAGEVADRAGERLRLSANHTVVGLAGATGSGKSSTFNALTGLELSAVGVRRPTTSWATACVWGREGAEELLDYLGIPPRHQVTRDSMLDTRRETDAMQGVVLLDLPDHDSTDVSHHLEADRLVQLADVLVWVLDPQKYADAAIHDRYLKPLASHSEVMVVVLNHIDTVPEDRREAMVKDVKRLLEMDGLPDVPVYAVSARHDQNLDALRNEITSRVAAKKATKLRIDADLTAVGKKLAKASGDVEPHPLSKAVANELEDAFADAAGVPVVVDAVEQAARLRARRATGWPVTSWVGRLKPDPLKRLHLDLGRDGKALAGTARTSVPAASPVQRARVDSAVRDVTDELGQGLERPWQQSLRKAGTARLDELNDRLDATLGATDLGVAKLPWWASTVRLLQWLLIGCTVVGGLWLAGLAAGAFLKLPEIPTPELGPIPVPTGLFLLGLLGGIALALFCRLLVAGYARGRARAADKRLREGIDAACQELVLRPLAAELEAYETVRSNLKVLLG